MEHHQKNGPKPTAVVVNDDATQCKALSGLLTQEGIEVRTFESAGAALEAFAKESPPDLIVTDLYMPGIDGWRFCRLLRSPEYAAFNRVPILVVSATFAGEEASRITANLGANAFLPSPVEGPRFIEQVHMLLRGEQSQETPRVLIVDDSRTLAGLLKKAFDAHGYRTETALSGRNAIEAFQKAPYDLVILDYHLPDMQGDALLKDFRQQRPDTVCIMITTDPRPDLALQWMRQGAAAYARKPFEPQYLIRLCEDARRERALLRVEDLLEERTRASRESEARYRRITEGLTDYLYTVRVQDGRAVETTHGQACETVTGYTAEEFAADPYLWIRMVVGEERDQVIERVQRILAGEEILPIEHRIVRKDGQIRWVSDTLIQQVDSSRRLVSYDGVIKDITEHRLAEEALRDSEERYRSLVANATDMIFIAQDGFLRFPNPATLTISGYSEEELSTLPFANIIHPEDKEMVIEKHTRRLKGEELPNIYSFRILTKGGEVLWVQLNAVLITWEGRPGVLCSLRDITPQKRLEEQYLHAQKMEAVGTLAGGVAHDFNNLLQAILGNAQMFLMEKKAEDPGYQQLVAIKQAAQRGAELTQRLLTFSRKVQSKPKVLNLNQEVMQVEKLLRRTIPKMIEVELRLSGDLWAISADPVQMGQVIMNLALNARDAMPEGGKLVIGTKNVALGEEFCKSHVGLRAGSYVLLSVSDTGQGMGKEVLQHLFEPFFTTKEVGRGTGLGLAMVYGIVKGHEGYIECESELGKGSIFKIYFLAVEQAVEEEEAEEEERPRGGRETILLVDDEESLRDLAKEILSTFGYTVITASDGEEALEIYRREKDKIHLIILDIIMPGIGGMRCLEGLQSINPEVRVVIATGYTPEGEAGGYISKPYDMRELLRVVRQALDK